MFKYGEHYLNKSAIQIPRDVRILNYTFTTFLIKLTIIITFIVSDIWKNQLKNRLALSKES